MADFVSGEYTTADYTPGAEVLAGKIVVLADTVRICHRTIAANKLGALAARGGNYRHKKDSTSGPDWPDGTVLYYDDANDEITDVAGSLKKIGTAVGTVLAADTTCVFNHNPA